MKKLKRIKDHFSSLSSEQIEIMQSVVDFFVNGAHLEELPTNENLKIDDYLIDMSIRYIGSDVHLFTPGQRIDDNNCDVWKFYDKNDFAGFGVAVRLEGEFKKNRFINCRFSVFIPCRIVFLNCGPFYD